MMYPPHVKSSGHGRLRGRKRPDVCVLDERGEKVAVTATPPDRTATGFATS